MHRSSLGDGRGSVKAEKITKTNKYEGPGAGALGYGVSSERDKSLGNEGEWSNL